MLACVLAKVGGVDEIPDALKVFEAVRKERAERIQSSATETRRVLHLPDGEEQRERDRRMKARTRREHGQNETRERGEDIRNPDLWADGTWQGYMWGVDIMKEALQAWEGR